MALGLIWPGPGCVSGAVLLVGVAWGLNSAASSTSTSSAAALLLDGRPLPPAAAALPAPSIIGSPAFHVWSWAAGVARGPVLGAVSNGDGFFGGRWGLSSFA